MSKTVLPSGWRPVQLGQIVREGPSNGYSPASGTDAQGTLTLRLSATSQGHLILNKETTKRLHETIPDASKYWLEPGDLLVQRSNTLELVGACAVFDGPPKTYIYPDLMMRLRFEDAGTTRWVWRYLNTAEAKQYFQQVAGGSAGSMPKITGEKLKALWLPLPPPHECERIADILDKADAIRRKRKEAIALTEELLRSAFLEMFGDPMTNPRGWKEQALGELADVASGVAKGKQYNGMKTVSVPYMRVANVQDGHLVLDDVKTITVSEDEARRYLLEPGDVLLTEGGDPDKLGRGAVWRGNIEGCIHQNHIFRVRASQAVLPEYLSALIGSERGKRYFLRAAKQTTGIATINMTQLKAFPALVPPPDAQRRYLAVVERVAMLRRHQDEAALTHDELFNSLVHRAFRWELGAHNRVSEQQLELFHRREP